jgi:hypothetical protein
MMVRRSPTELVEPVVRQQPTPVRRWRPAEVVLLVAAVCYSAAMIIIAAGVFMRLAR